MKVAKEKGLPDGWTLKWDPKWNKKVWISPHGRVCGGLPHALRTAAQMRQKRMQVLKGALSRKEAERTMEKAKSKGLPDGWTVVWSFKTKKKEWISPFGVVCGSIPKALENSAQQKDLTQKDVAKALLTARKQGLPNEWKAELFSPRVIHWISPKGRVYNLLSKAFKASGAIEYKEDETKDIRPKSRQTKRKHSTSNEEDNENLQETLKEETSNKNKKSKKEHDDQEHQKHLQYLQELREEYNTSPIVDGLSLLLDCSGKLQEV